MLIKLTEISRAEGITVYAVPGTKIMFTLTDAEKKAFPNYDLIMREYSDMLRSLTRDTAPPSMVPQPPDLSTPAPRPDKPLTVPQRADTPQETAPSAPQEPTPQQPQPDQAPSELMSDKWLGDRVDKSKLPFRVNDDAEPTERISVEVAQEIADNWDSLVERDRAKLVRKIARIKVHDRMKVKDILPQELKGMIVSISANKDGANSSFIPASESAFFGVEQPDFGLNKSAPLANIPEDFDRAAQGKGPATEYRSVASLESMLKGD